MKDFCIKTLGIIAGIVIGYFLAVAIIFLTFCIAILANLTPEDVREMATVQAESLAKQDKTASDSVIVIPKPKPTLQMCYYSTAESYGDPFLDDNKSIIEHVNTVCERYPNVPRHLVLSVIYHESRFNPKAVNGTGTCVGLMQVSTKWNKDRAKRLKVTDFYDPYFNILLGVDILDEFYSETQSWELSLMLYNMNHKTARRLYNSGTVSKYAKSVLATSDKYKGLLEHTA